MRKTHTAPVLEITDGQGRLLTDATFRLLATMFYPDDEVEGEVYLETLLARFVISKSESVPQALLAEASRRSDQVEAILECAARRAAYGVTIAGDLLLSIASAAAHSPKDASLARSTRAWCEDQGRGVTGEGEMVPASPRSVMAAWMRFKPVVHFCAAWRLHRDFGEKSQLDLTDPSQLPNFLAASETLRILGEHHHPPSGRFGTKSAKKTTLDPETMWHLPQDLVLPTIWLQVPPPTEFVKRSFSDYRMDPPKAAS